MATYGRYVTNGDYDFGELATNQQRATVYEKMPSNAWGYRLGFWGGKLLNEATPSVRVAVWSTTNMNPDAWMGHTAAMSLTTAQSYGRDGKEYIANVGSTNRSYSPKDTAIKMYAGYNYAIGLVGTGAPSGFAMVAASRITGTNELLYTRNSQTTPRNPFGYTSATNEGWLSCWIEYVANRAPTAGASTPSGLITTTTPSFAGTFSDPDATYGDRMTRIRIQVIRASDSALVWDSGSLVASSSEQTSNSFNRALGSSALAAGVEYKWRVQVADDFGTWSAWTAYKSFTVNGGGYLNNQTTPTGKQNTQKPTPFTATWRHANGLAMNMFRVRLMQGSSVLKTSGDITGSASNNGTVSTSWATAFGTYSLPWGASNLGWQIQGRDTGGMWSPWTATLGFYTNSPPDVPYSLTPTNSIPSTSRPLLKAKATDANGDAVTVKARIKNSAGTVLQTRTMVNRGGGNYEYQTTSTDLATFGTYKWDSYSFDGSLYSGAVTSEASATKSAEASFIFGEGPVVVVTGPVGTISTSSPTVTWTATDQVKYRVVLENNGAVVYDSGTVTSTAQSRVIPAGIVRNGQTYDVTVTVTNSAPLSGSSPTVSFTVSYPMPDVITGLTASQEFQRFDDSPSAIRLTWDESTDPNFAEYLIARSDGIDEKILARITSPSQTVFVDYHPESDVEYTYSIVQATLQGLDVTVGPATVANQSVHISHVILASIIDGEGNRVGLRLDSERSFDHHNDLVLEHAWGDSAPVAAYGTSLYQTFSGTFTLATDDVTDARDYIVALRNLWKSRETVSFRDERGRRFFCKITAFSEDDKRIQSYTVKLTLTEVRYSEGVGS